MVIKGKKLRQKQNLVPESKKVVTVPDSPTAVNNPSIPGFGFPNMNPEDIKRSMEQVEKLMESNFFEGNTFFF